MAENAYVFSLETRKCNQNDRTKTIIKREKLLSRTTYDERTNERERCKNCFVSLATYIYIYIYIYNFWGGSPARAVEFYYMYEHS